MQLEASPSGENLLSLKKNSSLETGDEEKASEETKKRAAKSSNITVLEMQNMHTQSDNISTKFKLCKSTAEL